MAPIYLFTFITGLKSIFAPLLNLVDSFVCLFFPFNSHEMSQVSKYDLLSAWSSPHSAMSPASSDPSFHIPSASSKRSEQSCDSQHCLWPAWYSPKPMPEVSSWPIHLLHHVYVNASRKAHFLVCRRSQQNWIPMHLNTQYIYWLESWVPSHYSICLC